MTTNPQSLIRTRRSLYEALLQLEQQNAVVVERALHHVDVALSPSTCLCIWTEQALLQVSHVTPFSDSAYLAGIAMLLSCLVVTLNTAYCIPRSVYHFMYHIPLVLVQA